MLPERQGPRPRTTPTNPHSQLDQQPAAADLGAALAARAFALPGVRERPSVISVPGARALWLDEDVAAGPAEAFLIGREFAHLHPPPDGSLHLALPRALAAEAVATGWAEEHPIARTGLIPPTVVMAYAPRDAAELDVIAGLVAASHRFACGESMA